MPPSVTRSPFNRRYIPNKSAESNRLSNINYAFRNLPQELRRAGHITLSRDTGGRGAGLRGKRVARVKGVAEI